MNPVVSVVVPMIDAADDIENLILSLLSQDFEESWEIIVVDNDSGDDSVKIARRLLGVPLLANVVRAEVIIESTRRGYPTPRNAGARLAKAPLLGFCDSDDAVDEHWLKEIVHSLGRNPLVGSRKY